MYYPLGQVALYLKFASPSFTPYPEALNQHHLMQVTEMAALIVQQGVEVLEGLHQIV